MTTKTERDSIAVIQRHLRGAKHIAKTEMKANLEAGEAEHANAWMEAHAVLELAHAQLTTIGLKVFPEFFSDIVIKGGGGR